MADPQPFPPNVSAMSMLRELFDRLDIVYRWDERAESMTMWRRVDAAGGRDPEEYGVQVRIWRPGPPGTYDLTAQDNGVHLAHALAELLERTAR